jgi:hypothetical protein
MVIVMIIINKKIVVMVIVDEIIIKGFLWLWVFYGYAQIVARYLWLNANSCYGYNSS